MTLDPSFIEHNRASTNRLRALVTRLSEKELQYRVGEHWTVSIALAHLAFWDGRVMSILETTELNGQLFTPEIDIVVNDIALPFWAAIPPREAVRLALETAQALDERLVNFPAPLLEEINACNERWVIRAAHRNEHLDEIEAALKNKR